MSSGSLAAKLPEVGRSE